MSGSIGSWSQQNTEFSGQLPLQNSASEFIDSHFPNRFGKPLPPSPSYRPHKTGDAKAKVGGAAPFCRA
jgi:hypothetical protein